MAFPEHLRKALEKHQASRTPSKILFQDKSMPDPFRVDPGEFKPKPMPWNTWDYWAGIPVEIDPTLPPGTWEFRYPDEGSDNHLLPESKRND